MILILITLFALIGSTIVTSVSSDSVDDLISLAYKEARSGNVKAAASRFHQAADIASSKGDISTSAQLYFNSGHAYNQLIDYPNAIKSYKNCLKVSKNSFRPCHIKMASVYRDIEDMDNAQKHLLKAIDMEPKNADAFSYLAQILNNMKQFNKSIEYYKAAIARSPQDPNLWGYLGDTYSNTKQISNALHAFKKGLDLSQQNSLSHINALIGLYFSSLDLLKWKHYELYTDSLIKDTLVQVDLFKRGKAPPSPLAPYRLLFLSPSSEFFLEIAMSWSNELVRSTLASSEPAQYTTKSNTLNIGYISRRFEDYPGTQMMLRVFKSHSRQKGFKVHSFAHGTNDGSVEREIVRSSSDVFEDISKLSAAAAAQTIAHYSIDILVDYDGLHDFNNMKVLALRPAAIQITWLGFAGTTGQGYRNIKNSGRLKTEAIEYIITDRYVSPPDRQFARFYSEHMIIMPRTYQPQDGERVLTLPFIGSIRNERVALLSKYFPQRQHHESIAISKWLICFNRPAKITPDAFEDWMMIMKKKINTYLVLMVEADEAKAEIQAQASYWGIDPNRLLIFQRVPRNEYYAILAMSDLFLDSRHYGSHTVASDAMLYSIPVITLAGDTFASRVATSLNSATKMDVEVVSYSRRSLVDSVIQILSDESLMAEISKKLKKSIGTCIFNDEAFTLHLEQAYLALHELKSFNIHSHLFFPTSTC